MNTIGSFVLAVLTFTSIEGSLRYMISIGMLGSFTTFSTFAYESFRLLDEGESKHFLMNIGFNLSLCLLAVFIAHILIRGVI